MATTPSSASRTPVKSTVRRLGDEAAKAAAQADAAKQGVRSAKAALKRARKLSKTAKKTAKLARKRVDAATTAIKLAAAAKTGGTPAAAGKAKSRTKIVKRTSSATPASPANAVIATPSKTPRMKLPPTTAARTAAASRPAKAGASPLLSASEVAKSVIDRLAAAKRKKKTVAVAASDTPSAGAAEPLEGRDADPVSAEFEAGAP